LKTPCITGGNHTSASSRPNFTPTISEEVVMAHPYHHALSSVKKWGGSVEDYLALHEFLDVIWTGKAFLDLSGSDSP
jgi:hypothetical protein